MGAGLPLEAEVTPVGQQSLVPGVTPCLPADRLVLRAAAPLRSAKPQKPASAVHFWGLFDLNARDQLDLFAPSGD
jgi:hypothetical protein